MFMFLHNIYLILFKMPNEYNMVVQLLSTYVIKEKLLNFISRKNKDALDIKIRPIFLSF